MASGQIYSIRLENGRVVFRTKSFRAEEGSFLHSGIFNRELTSSLASGAVTIGAFVALYLTGVALNPWYILLALALFTAMFVAFRVLVFYESYLEAVFDKAKRRATVLVKSFTGKRMSVPFEDIEAIGTAFTMISPENVDGIKVVEKIALQHGTVIPGFGEAKEYHTVNLELKDGRIILLFSTLDKAEADDVKNKLKQYVGGFVAKED